ncbi:TlpA family protein disulfide reductase [Halosolutus gelatinilyticus]|uniref:TlpA family protein disulfide reductase n=1 Tax=Halosolutus gelatinilyticus TaxID=2931975 RepID=UPI001FF5104A|nr:hypothetical protein [Halosolutus gelatinilyticus]
MSIIDRGPVDRRRVLQVVGTSALASIAGCISDDGGTDGEGGEDVNPESVDVADDATWRTASLTDVTSDEEFRVADFDRPAIVHTFSRGCTACHAQQKQFADFYATAGDVEIVDLTIDPNDDPEKIRTYASEDGFEWRFGTSTEDVTRSLIDDFGRDVTTSAASPVIVVCPNGGVYSLDKVVDAGPLESVLDGNC